MAKKYDYFDNQLEAQRWALRAKVTNLTKLAEKLESAESEFDFLYRDEESCKLNGDLVNFIERVNEMITENEREIIKLDNEIQKGEKQCL